MIVSPKETVEGVLYFDVDAQDLAALDAFEGSEYRRDQIEVVINYGETVIACTYIFMAEHRLSGVPWEPQSFQVSRFIGDFCHDVGSDKLSG